MRRTIAHQREHHRAAFDPGCEPRRTNRGGRAVHSTNHQLVARHPIGMPVPDREARPPFGDTRPEHQGIAAADRHSQHRLERHPEHPPRRSGVPGPTTASSMRRFTVDVGRDHIRFDLIGSDCLGRPAAGHRTQHLEQLRSAVVTSRLGERPHGPERSVRVLAAILAHPRQIALDVARVVRCPIEWRCQQSDQAGWLVDEVVLHRIQGLHGARRRRHTRHHRPRLRDGIDPALIARRRANRRAIVVVGAAIPLTIPPGGIERGVECAHSRLIALDARQIATLQDGGKESIEDGIKKESHPDTLAAPEPADAVHPVVPVSGADQRQPVDPAPERPVDCPATVLIDVGV